MGTENKILIIAECGHNANGSMRHMKKQIEAAKETGADIAKFQVYDTDKILKPTDMHYMELKMSELNKEDVQKLANYCKKIGIEFMASAFDPERVEWLERVGVKRHKIASRSIYDTATIEAMKATGKPIIASLGMLNEKKDVPFLENTKYLYCVAEYPAIIDSLPNFGYEYDGFSDHTIGIEWAKQAVKQGATIIEKHFTLDKTLPGCDQAGSADPKDMKELVTFIREYEKEHERKN